MDDDPWVAWVEFWEDFLGASIEREISEAVLAESDPCAPPSALRGDGKD